MIKKIKELKERRNAIILAHNYQPGKIQDIADFVGDSLGLSRNAAKSHAKVIVFCGVRFMAETATILCPEKTVIMPDIDAICPMANMITVKDLRSLKNQYPESKVVCYVNTTAEVKAESDICCTSSNAVTVVDSLRENEIIFVPDKYLAHYVSTKTNKTVIPWNGFCPTHASILPEHIKKQKEVHPKSEVMVHPECTPSVIALADVTLSTGGMLRYAKGSKTREFIVGTEIGILYRLQKENPKKKFYPASELAVCPSMKLINLKKILLSLEQLTYKVEILRTISLRAKDAVEKMLAIV